MNNSNTNHPLTEKVDGFCICIFLISLFLIFSKLRFAVIKRKTDGKAISKTVLFPAWLFRLNCVMHRDISNPKYRRYNHSTAEIVSCTGTPKTIR